MNSYKILGLKATPHRALIAGIESSFDYEYRREFEARIAKALIVV
jgi:hypothetical protein